ncbi:DUF3443 family protein [Trinickia violacea]|uniref:DUF3443 family protein n=1 Tax=Trinickia violacea TaxID=2571746 RepID=A0A4P8J4S0_9BURK|nr:DUF3443 family protein [Trinickia violacea]QCP55114.1 DUF3443 family protein [Trinickia violacea]
MFKKCKIEIQRYIVAVTTMGCCVALSACGGGGGGGSSSAPATTSSSSSGNTTSSSNSLPNVAGIIPTGANVLQVSINQASGGYQNVAMASVTICAPGSATSCVTVDNMTVDTGSVGIRINASALSNLTLPGVTNAGGYQAAECQAFITSAVWGAVRLADVSLGGETAHNLPIQVVADAGIPSAPSDCSALPHLPGNGTIGIGYNSQDCGTTCASTSAEYYACPAGEATCGHSKLPLASQVSNPIAGFTTDNNGVIFELPAIPTLGASTVSGAIVFGIGTQTNNSPSGMTVLPVSSQVGTLAATINGVAYPQSLIDSGTGFITFADAGIPICSSGKEFCPASPQTIGVALQGVNGGSTLSETFPVIDASTQAAGSATYVASVSNSTTRVILGLPFFYGRTIAFALTGANTSLGAGPFVAM